MQVKIHLQVGRLLFFAVTRYIGCLSIINRREIEDLKILDTNETGTLENSRETPLKKETDFWVALGARVRLQTRNLQITRHRHLSIQANTGLLKSTQNCLPCEK